MARDLDILWDISTGELSFVRTVGNYVKRGETLTISLTIEADGVASTSIPANTICTLKQVNNYATSLASWTSFAQVGSTNVFTASTTLNSSEISTLLGTAFAQWNCVMDCAGDGVNESDTLAVLLKNNVTRDDDTAPSVLRTRNDFLVSNGTGLLANVGAGILSTGASIAAQTSIALTNNATNYVQLNSSGVASANTSAYTDGYYPLALIVTASGAITSNTDRRPWIDLKGGGGGSTISTGKQLWVDSVNGSDANAGTLAAPFLTLAAAKAAASSGDTINVGPGSYAVTDSILKNGVNWYFDTGSTVTKATSESVGILDDKGVAITCAVTGEGTFSVTSTSTSLTNFGTINVTHASSNIYVRGFDCTYYNPNTTSLPQAAINQTDGTLVYEFRTVSQTGAAEGAMAVFWMNGTMRGKASLHHGDGYAIWGRCNSTPTGDMFIETEDATAANPCVVSDGTNTEGVMWIRAKTIRGTGGTYLAIQNQLYGNKLYVTAQKIFGRIDCGAGRLYVTADKQTATANANSTYGLFLSTLSSTADGYITIRHYDASTFTGQAIIHKGGNLRVFGGQYVAGASASGMSFTGLSGGTILLSDCTFDFSSSAVDLLTLSAGSKTINVENCHFTSNGANYDLVRTNGTLNVSGGWGTGAGGNFTTSGTVNFNIPSGVPVGSITGLGTDVATALATSVNDPGAFVVLNGSLGTPGNGTLTNCDSLPVATGISGLGTGVATALAENVTGSGGIALSTSPTFSGLFSDGLNASGSLSVAAAGESLFVTNITNGSGIGILPSVGLKWYSDLSSFSSAISFVAPTAARQNFVPNSSGTFVTTGNLSAITATGTLTSGATGAGFTVALGSSTITGTLAATNGGTGVSNAGTFTNASNTTVTGGGTIALGGFTLTVPATGTAALLGTANTFTAAQTNSTAGATSLPAMKWTGVPFAGTGTTSFPLVYINDANATASTTLSTAGTYFGINGDGTQDLIHALKDGVTRFKVESTGIATHTFATTKAVLTEFGGSYGYMHILATATTASSSNYCLACDGSNLFVQAPAASGSGIQLGASSILFNLAATSVQSHTFSNKIIATPQALSGAGAVNITTAATDFTSTGASQALTLADGTVGQIKTITHIVDGGSGILTPTTKTGYTTITFTNAGDSVTLRYCTTAGWCIIGSFGVTIA